MSHPQPAPMPANTSADTDDVALDWFVRRAGGSFDAADEAALGSWLAADVAHAAAFARYQDDWRILDALPADGVRTLKQNLAHDRSALARATPRKSAWWRGHSLWPLRTAVAGVVLTVACGGYLAWSHWLQQPVFSQQFATERGQQLEVSLPEGSHLRLDTLTRADVAIFRERREVRLPKGQAVFQVQGDPERPFDVLAGPLRITVVGTRFSVRYTPDVPGREGVQVAVEEGRVRVARASPTEGAPSLVELVAGQQVTSDSSGLLGAVSVVPAAGIAPWRESRVSFDDVRLDQVLAEFGRYGPVHLSVREPAVAAMRVTGTFDPRRLDNFAHLLPWVLPVQLRKGEGGVEVVRAAR